MAFEVFLLIIGVVIGFLIAWYIYSQQKWSDKREAIDAKWEKKIAELEKDYGIKLEGCKTNIEKMDKNWQEKYLTDLKELKEAFGAKEKEIRTRSITGSRRSLIGKYIEKFIPFISKIPYAPSDMCFLGKPVDYIVFEGMGEKGHKIQKVTFLEVKTGKKGKAGLSPSQRSLKEVIEKKKVFWEEVRIDTYDEKAKEKIDKDIAKTETVVKDLYEDIDYKLKEVKQKKVDFSDKEDDENKEFEEGDEVDVICPQCGEEFEIELEQDDDFKKGVKTDCAECDEEITLHEEDIAEEEEEDTATIKIPKSNMEKAKAKYPRAYTYWSKKEEEILTDLFTKKVPIERIAKNLKRQPSAIKRRLEKLGLIK